MATIAAVFGQLERDAIKTRTRDALADKRRQGVHTGRKIETPREIRDRIEAMRAQPKPATYRAIAAALNADDVPTTRPDPEKDSHEWTASAVYSIDAAGVREKAEGLGIGRVGMTVQELRTAVDLATRQIAVNG
jgi:DNA invertase Pin-like site-specific DNA recombinase